MMMGFTYRMKVTIQIMEGHDGNGGYEDHRGECDERSDLVVLSEFVDEDEGSEFVDFEDLVATVLTEAAGNEVCEIEWQPSD